MRAKKSTFGLQSGQLIFHATNFPRSRMETTSASTTNRIVPTGQLHHSRGLTGFRAWRANLEQSSSSKAQASASQPALDASEPLRDTSMLSSTRVRGARGHAPARARGERGARPGERAAVLRRRRRCALQTKAVWAGEGAKRRRYPEPRGRAGLARREQTAAEGTLGSRPEAGEPGLSIAGLRGRRLRPSPGVAAAPGVSP